MNRRRKEILVVDDDRSILDSVKEILESEGYDVEVAESGKEAIGVSKARIFNLALLDIRLPDIDGMELLTYLQQALPRMKKIMITGYPSLETAVGSMNLGADAYIIKPINPKEMLAVVEEKLKEQEEEEAVDQKRVAEWVETRVRKLELERKMGKSCSPKPLAKG